MKNFGLEELYLVAPRCSLRPRAYHLASHARDLLDCAVICETLRGGPRELFRRRRHLRTATGL